MKTGTILNQETLQQALWDAYSHRELDALAFTIQHGYIDGNDHPVLAETAKAILNRLPARYVTVEEQ